LSAIFLSLLSEYYFLKTTKAQKSPMLGDIYEALVGFSGLSWICVYQEYPKKAVHL